VLWIETFDRSDRSNDPSESSWRKAILSDIPAPASEFQFQRSTRAESSAHKAMAKQPWHRFSTAKEFGELCKSAAYELIEEFKPGASGAASTGY